MAQRNYRPLEVHKSEIEQDSLGFILDVFPSSRRENPHVGYISNTDYRLNDPFVRASIKQDARNQRDAFARPHILGSFSAPESLCVPKQDGVQIKSSRETKIFIPDYYEFALPIVDLALKDTLKLYGRDKFKDANILLVVKNSEVEQQTAQREDFAHWHDHFQTARHKIDLIYTFHTTLPTQFKAENQALQPPENTILRFGGEVLHRSQTNTGSKTQRLWGAILVEEKENMRNGLPDNAAYVDEKDPLYKKFFQAANERLKQKKSVFGLSVPIALAEYEGTLHLQPE